MDPISRELKLIEKTDELAWSYVEAGEWRKARRTLKKIQRSFCVTESDRVVTSINAEIFARQGKVKEAQDTIRSNIYSIWGYPPIWAAYNRSHAEVDASTSSYLLAIRGANKLVGDSDTLLATLIVLANTLDEALEYVEELELYVEDFELSRLATSDFIPEEVKTRGIAYCYPFTDASEYPDYWASCLAEIEGVEIPLQ